MHIESYRLEYLANVCAAMADYVKAEHEVHIDSERDAQELQVRFTLSDADAFHAFLSARMGEEPTRRLVEDGGQAVVTPES